MGNGNRTSKKPYSYTTGTLGIIIDTDTYLYESALWGDGLSGYYNSTVTEDDYFIIYDNIGNPLSYYVNGNSCSLTWTDGRRLSKVELSNGEEYTFTYNDEGIRTSKTVNGVGYYYTLNGTQILTEQWQDKFVAYIYDETGAPIGMQYRISSYAEGVFDTYYFEKNLQGDIVSVYNASGTKLVSYSYDAWGNFEETPPPANIGGAQYNPFRYRGYYYDTDLGLYYLNNRYYDSNTGRFLNADGQLNGGLLGYNQYSYCENNPVIRVDFNGEMWQFVPALHPLSICYGVYIRAMGGVPGQVTDSSAYGTYQMKSNNARADANLGGYYYGGGATLNPGYYIVPGAVSVTDDMATKTTTIYRSVSVEEAQDISNSGQFRISEKGMDCKQFGFNLNEVRQFGNIYNQNIIVSAQLPYSMIQNYCTISVDTTIFRHGTLTVYDYQLKSFNKVIKGTIRFEK